jgi:hypothetical protein
MLREGLIFVGTCDIAGLVRGKGFPVRALKQRQKTGVGWTHSNLMQTCFGPIFDTPFGTAGDLMIVPDPAAEVDVDFGDGSAPEHFILGDICNTDGSAWECCPREFLRRGAASLREVSGFELIAAFEQEFVYTGLEDRPGHAYSLNAFRRQGVFGESLIAALRAAGVTPDSFLAEYGPRQFEVTVAPASALHAADAAVIGCELARAAAFRLGHRATRPCRWPTASRQRGTHPFQSARRRGCACHLRRDRATGLERGCGPVRRRRARPSAGHRRHHRAVASILSTPHAEPLGAHQDRYRQAGPRRRLAGLPDIRRHKAQGHRQGIQSRVPRLRRRRQSLSRARRAALCRRRSIPRKLPLPQPGDTAKPLPHSLEAALDRMEQSEAVER